MSAPTPANKIHVASITDRGLSEKRPLNEDSFLADAERGIFAVADGVGGADAGEVASQTAIDVLTEAFRHQLGDGDDVDDLMELAIQRANSSIHQMAAEHPRFSMMATTIVALHVGDGKATFGHVGDSRLYRLSPDGNYAEVSPDDQGAYRSVVLPDFWLRVDWLWQDPPPQIEALDALSLLRPA